MSSLSPGLCEVSLDEVRGDLWVFGYGSLMWRPGFAFEEMRRARVVGWRRRLCIFSHIYRGTKDRPGVVLGLDKGDECHGVAYRVPARERERTVGYLRERELVTSVYRENLAATQLDSGVEVTALTYVADRQHEQYAGKIPRDELLEIVRSSVGSAGTNVEYVVKTYEHLRMIEIEDEELSWLCFRLRGS